MPLDERILKVVMITPSFRYVSAGVTVKNRHQNHYSPFHLHGHVEVLEMGLGRGDVGEHKEHRPVPL